VNCQIGKTFHNCNQISQRQADLTRIHIRPLGSEWLNGFQKFFNSMFVDSVLPTTAFLEIRSDNESICSLKIGNVVRVDSRPDQHRKPFRFRISILNCIQNLFQFSFRCRRSGGTSGDDDSVGGEEFRGFGGFADVDVGRDGVSAVLLLKFK
jgi:hypothetical protein